MILTLKELADYLRVNERTILRMLKSGQIKGAKIGGQWRFNGSQIDELFFPPEELEDSENVSLKDITSSNPTVIPVNRVVRENRILSDLQSKDAESVLRELLIPVAKESLLLDVKDLLDRLSAREQLISTGVGNNVAIPHPRDPIATLRVPAIIVIGRSKKGIDFNAADGKPVHLFFMLCCKNIEAHLMLMGRLARLLQNKDLFKACMEAQTEKDIFRAVLDAEQHYLFTSKKA